MVRSRVIFLGHRFRHNCDRFGVLAESRKKHRDRLACLVSPMRGRCVFCEASEIRAEASAITQDANNSLHKFFQTKLDVLFFRRRGLLCAVGTPRVGWTVHLRCTPRLFPGIPHCIAPDCNWSTETAVTMIGLPMNRDQFVVVLPSMERSRSPKQFRAFACPEKSRIRGAAQTLVATS